ncbi:MAG: VanZ family protein [Gammaproteobacteria bacterium]
MLERPPPEKEWVSWSFVALWSLIIFVTIPLARIIQGFVEEQWGRDTFTYLVIGVTLVAATAAVGYLKHVRAASPINYIWLFLVSAVFISYTIQLRKAPEEAMHFVQYGVLGVLSYRALCHRIRDVSIYFAAAIIGAIVGMVDETIQWITPSRYWGLRDIWLNFFAASLSQVAIAKGLNPTVISGPPVASSVRLLCRLSAVALLLLGVSLVNTPARIAWYADRIPILEFLQTNRSVMAEYGYLYVDPVIGTFRSRFSPLELGAVDADRGTEAARILDRFRGDRATYLRFLEKYTAANDPFVHEARVHLFRRDRYFEKSEKVKHNIERYRDYLTVAFRENQIMEKYFKNTLHHSTYVLPPEQVAYLREHLLPDHDYESPVSRSLFTRIREGQLIGALALALLGLLVVDRYYGKEKAAKASS